MLIHYTGCLGDFYYDTDEWVLDENSRSAEMHALRYVGVEIDGMKIEIPRGIVSCYEMFKGCLYLVRPPFIPEGVVNTSRMFVGCRFLEEPPLLPGSLLYCYEMFKGCSSLKRTPLTPPGVRVKHHMYDGCPAALREAL
jgi:hypothetical protein